MEGRGGGRGRGSLRVIFKGIEGDRGGVTVEFWFQVLDIQGFKGGEI